MAKKYIVLSLVIGIAIGITGSYFSHDFSKLLGIDQSMFSFLEKENLDKDVNVTQKSIVTNDLRYTLVSVKTTDFGINGEKPLSGGIFIVTKVEIENFAKEEVIVYGKNWKLIDENDRIYTPRTFDASPENNENIFSLRIPPGFKIVTNIGFEIPSSIDSSRELFVADKPFDSKPILLGVV